MSVLVNWATGRRWPIDAPLWRAPGPDGPQSVLDIHCTARFDPSTLDPRSSGVWRYRSAIVLSPGAEPLSIGEATTPLWPVRVPTAWGVAPVLLKNEGLFPTGSYKDRGAAAMIAQARALGIRRVVEDSSGNAGSAVAAYCAAAGIECEIFVPESTSPGKLAQIRASGAVLRRVPGTRQDTADATWAAAQRDYYASHSWNPFFFQGTKTFAYEVCEQLGWRAPGAVIIPTGNGTLLLGAWIGFAELAAARVIDRVPRLVAVQAANCSPLEAAFARGWDEPAPIPVTPTIGEGVAIARPIRGAQCLRAVRETGGRFVAVAEAEIVAALRRAFALGVFCEPTCATAFAALDHIPELLDECSRAGREVVVPITGHGLKAAATIDKLLGP